MDSFIMTYAKQRCNVIHQLRLFGVSRKGRKWAHSIETCFQEKLMEHYPAKLRPDPQTCLTWERQAIDLMNSCYTQGKYKLHELSSSDIQRLVGAFRLGGPYYNASIVDDGLVKLVANANEAQLASLQTQYTTSTKNRIILCVQASKYSEGNGADDVEPTPEELLNAVSSQLNSGRENFHYAGPDQFEDVCFNRSNDLNANSNDYHLVTWFTDKNRDVIESRGIIHQQDQQVVIYGGMFELTSDNPKAYHPRKRTRCGDGIRQLSEACDLAANYPSCTVDCRVRRGHDCTAEKLEPSKCWVEECGDGLTTVGEECDDHNTADGDGCSRTCRVEHATHICSTKYNMTSNCTPAQVVQQKQAPAKLMISQSARIVSAEEQVLSSSSSSGETMKRTVEAVSGCPLIRYSLWLMVGLLAVSVLTLR